MEVTRVHQQFFFQITWDTNEIETWDWCHCVCLRKAHWMMYKLTYLGHQVTLPWLDLRSNFDLDLSRSNYTWFDAPWRDKHDGIKIVALPLNLNILSSKNRFVKFWNFDPWWPQFWPESKNNKYDFEIIFRELSNPVFRFVLRCAGAEIDGGGGCSTPLPPYRWKIQRPIRARVNPPPPGEGVSDPTPFGFSGITSFITVSTWNLAHLSGHQFGVVSCKENQNRPEIFCYRSNFVTSLHAILGRLM